MLRLIKYCCQTRLLTGLLSLNTVYNMVSSANNLMVTPTGAKVQISLTYNINSTGPRTLPWGTPLMTGRVLANVEIYSRFNEPEYQKRVLEYTPYVNTQTVLLSISHSSGISSTETQLNTVKCN